MNPTSLYLGAPGSGKSTLMREHVRALATREGAPLFFIVDHDDSWRDLAHALGGRTYHDTASWWEAPSEVSAFAGVHPHEVARLAIAVGYSVVVDDECDLALAEGSWKTENPLREIVKRGRHLRNLVGEVVPVSAMLATHRVPNLPSDVVGCFGRVYIGRMQGLRDAERVYRENWIPGARSVQEAMAALVNREPGDFTVWPS